MQAFRHSDLTGEALASGWIPGGEVIPTDFSKKVEYFVNKFGHGNKEKTDDGNENTEANDATATAKIEVSPEDEAAAAEPDEKSYTKSKVVIAEVHNSEEAAAVMSPAGETEALKDTPKQAEAKSITNYPAVTVEEKRKVEK